MPDMLRNFYKKSWVASPGFPEREERRSNPHPVYRARMSCDLMSIG
jgi:hypothetical protein